MKDITICFVYFRSLTLAHLAAALYSVRQQDFACVSRLIVIDNNTEDSLTDIKSVVDRFDFPVPVILSSYKHGDLSKTHSWSTNVAVRQVLTPWVFFTRADYLLAFDAVSRFAGERSHGFVTGNGCHLRSDIATCEVSTWRTNGPRVLEHAGEVFEYTAIDTGVWLGPRILFDSVGGLDESLTAWGHAQTHFQWKLYQSGVEFRRIPETMFFHPMHGGAKDLDLANVQLSGLSVTTQEMWSRYEGPRVY